MESIWHLPFQEERLSINWNGNLDSSIGKSVRLVIWRSEIGIPVRIQVFLLKSKLLLLLLFDKTRENINSPTKTNENKILQQIKPTLLSNDCDKKNTQMDKIKAPLDEHPHFQWL